MSRRRLGVAVGHFIGAAPRDPAKSAFGALVVTETHGKWTVAPAVGASAANEPWLSSVSCPSGHLCLAVGTDLIDAIHVPGGGFRAVGRARRALTGTRVQNHAYVQVPDGWVRGATRGWARS